MWIKLNDEGLTLTGEKKALYENGNQTISGRICVHYPKWMLEQRAEDDELVKRSEKDKTPDEEFKCLKCWADASELNRGGTYRKKCTECWHTNYRVKLFTDDHRYIIYKIWTKEDYEYEQEKWDTYYNEVYPTYALMKKYWRERFSKVYETLLEKCWNEPSLLEIELYFVYEELREAEKNGHVWWMANCYRKMYELLFREEPESSAEMYARYIAYVWLSNNLDYLKSWGEWCMHWERLWSFDEIISVEEQANVCRYDFEEFEKHGISVNMIRKRFYDLFPEYENEIFKITETLDERALLTSF